MLKMVIAGVVRLVIRKRNLVTWVAAPAEAVRLVGAEPVAKVTACWPTAAGRAARVRVPTLTRSKKRAMLTSNWSPTEKIWPYAANAVKMSSTFGMFSVRPAALLLTTMRLFTRSAAARVLPVVFVTKVGWEILPPGERTAPT